MNMFFENNDIKMNPAQVAYIQKEYAEHKQMELTARTVEIRNREAAVCAEIEKLAHYLGISQACLQIPLGGCITIH